MKVTGVGNGSIVADEVLSTLSSAFAAAGYKLVADAKEAQVMMNVNVRATEKPSFMQTTVNGQRQITWAVNIDATYTALSDSSMIDKTTATFESDNGVVDAAAHYQIEELIAQATKNGKLQKHAEALFQAAQDREKAKKEAEEKLWLAANADDCSKGTSKTACDGVKEYLRKYKDGAHAAEARKALEEHEMSKVAANDEEAWAAANADKCANPDTSKDCKGVERYLKKHPTGAHAAEAKETVAKAQPMLDKLKAAEEADRKKAYYDECVKECKREFIRYAPAHYQILVNRCIQADCR
jgi:hypothetical protein